MNRPEMIVVGGPNGAGKTTFVNRALRSHDLPYLGADKIAEEIDPDSPESVAFEAGREFITRMERQLLCKSSFIVESTLSGKSFSQFIKRAKTLGFSISITFAFLDSPTHSRERVAERVRRGGHHVPDEDINRRFPRSLANFWQIYRPLADEWLLTYNGEPPLDVARQTIGKTEVLNAVLLERFFQLSGIENDPTHWT